MADEQAKLQATIEAKGSAWGKMKMVKTPVGCPVLFYAMLWRETSEYQTQVHDPGWLMISLRVIQPIVFGILITRELGILMNQAVEWIQPSAQICQEKTQIQSELKNKDAEMQQQVGTRLWGKKWGNTGVLIKTSSNFMF